MSICKNVLYKRDHIYPRFYANVTTSYERKMVLLNHSCNKFERSNSDLQKNMFYKQQESTQNGNI